MRELLQNRDLKTLLAGVAVAAAAGLMMGAAMHPDLEEGKMTAPQILLAGGGPRSDGPAFDAGVAAYRGRIPDHVIGTDTLKPAQHQVLADDDRAASEYADLGETGDVMAYEAPAQVRPVRYQDEPREPTAYPSQRGNVALESDLPAPPTPPPEGDDATLDPR